MVGGILGGGLNTSPEIVFGFHLPPATSSFEFLLRRLATGGPPPHPFFDARSPRAEVDLYLPPRAASGPSSNILGRYVPLPCGPGQVRQDPCFSCVWYDL